MNAEPSVCINPVTNEVLGHSALNAVEDVSRLMERARAAQPIWAAAPVAERAVLLRRVRDHLVENADRLADIIARSTGKTRIDAMATEVLPAAMAVSYYCRKAESFLKDRRLLFSSLLLANKNSRLVRVPYGVLGIISPWNYPFAIPFSEVVMALLAGNAVLLKAASATQMVGRALEECIAAAGLPPGLFAYLNLPGQAAGEALLDAGVDKLFFTGSVAAGKSLMAMAARNLTPVVLELGGNDPMIVCADADLQRAARGAVWAGMGNCGQSCGGVERIYVQRSVYEPFLQELGRLVSRLRVGYDYDSDYRVDMGAMATMDQLEEVRRQVDAAVAAGAVIYARSEAPREEEGSAGRFLPAMVLTQVDHTMDLMRLETFGPVVGVMPVDDMQQAVSLANDSDLGLTASVWTADRKTGEKVARRIQAGVVMINDHLMSHGLPETPWGGFKHSGIGRTHGAAGMAEMTQLQCIVQDYMPRVKRNMWWHPYSPEVYKGLRGALDLLYGRKLLRDRLLGALRVMRLFPRTFFTGR